MSTTNTYYPDANPESTSVDGAIRMFQNPISWADLRNGAGQAAYPDAAAGYCFYLQSVAGAGNWVSMFREAYLFDTHDIGESSTILSATLSVYGFLKSDDLGIAPDLNVYSSSPASNTALVAGDFDSFGTTPFCDTPITYGGFSVSGYNDFVLNTAGLSSISKTGITKLGIRNANYDVANIEPAFTESKITSMRAYDSDQGVGYKPKLVITYNEGGSSTPTRRRFIRH